MADWGHLSSNVRSSSALPWRRERRQASDESWLVLQFALPNRHHSKAKRAKSTFLPEIACSIGTDLVFPPFAIGSRKSRQRARFVPVPEASMYEDAPSPGLVCDIWTARKIFGTHAISNSGAIEKDSQSHFRRCVTLPDGPHSLRGFGRRPRSSRGSW